MSPYPKLIKNSLFRLILLGLFAVFMLLIPLKMWRQVTITDFEKASGLSTVDELSARFITPGNTNDLMTLADMVTHPKFGSNAAATLRMLSRKVSTPQINNIIIPALINGLQHQDESVRRESALAIEEFAGATTASNAVPFLRGLLKEDNFFLQIAAASAIGAIGPASRKALPELLHILNFTEDIEGLEDGSLKACVAAAIRRVGFREEAVMRQVEQGLSDKNIYVRLNCAMAMIRNGYPTERAIAIVHQQLISEEQHMRRKAVVALMELDSIPPSLISVLQQLVSDSEPNSGEGAAARELLRRAESKKF